MPDPGDLFSREKLLETFLISFTGSEENAKTLAAIGFHENMPKLFFPVPYGGAGRIEDEMGNGMNFVHRLSTFTIP
jgi:hypothetical protein